MRIRAFKGGKKLKFVVISSGESIFNQKNAELKIKNSKEPQRAEFESARWATPQTAQNRALNDFLPL